MAKSTVFYDWLLSLTNKEISKKLNVSLKVVSHWRTGRGLPKAQTMKKIKHITGMSYEDIIEGSISPLK